MDMKVYKRVAWVLMAVMIGVIVYAAVAFQVEDMTVAKGKIDTFNEGWVLVREDGTRTDITLPHVSSCNADEVVVIENRIPEKFWGLTMSFLSADKELEVYIDGRMIYEFGKNDVRKFGHTPGSIYNFIDIPRNLPQGKIQIKMQSHYASYATNIAGIQVAKRDLSILSLFKQNVFPLLCNIIMLLAGIVFLVMALLQVLVIHKSYGVEYLGIYFLCTVGFYSIETKALSVFYGNQTVYSISVFMILMSGPILFCLYYLKNLEELTEQQQRRFRSLLVLSFGNVIVQLILQILDVVDFLDMAPMSHSLIFITLVVVSYTLLQLAKERRELGYYLEVLGLVFLASGTIIDIIRGNIFHIGDLGKYGRYGFTLFAVITIVVQIRKIMISYMEKIQKSNALLEEKMELLEIQNQELEQARENADAANSAKSDFLANMSHEIRTPINTVLGLNEMIVQETHEKAILGYSQNIKNVANSLLGIINDILDLSKIEAGKMMLVPVEYDLSSMLFDLANMISVRAAGKSLEFQMAVNPDIPAKLYGDDLKLRQIITNLLTNAVKYTHTGMVKLVVDGDVDEDMLLLQVSVEDTGIGIKQKDIDKLFQAFERIEESRNRNIEGTGLGMNITMQLLKMMDGELCVESEYGKGSRFYFEVEQHIVSEEKIGNFAERYHKSRKEEVKEGFLAPKANILVVDDNAMNRKVFAGLLKKTKMHIDEADSGMACLELVQKKKYDIIFLDHMMPEMDGIETLHRMQKLEDNMCKNSYIVSLTANAIAGAEQQYLAEGFDAYLSKPIIPEKLEELILEVLPGEYIEKCKIIPNRLIDEEEEDIELPFVEGFFWDYALHNSYSSKKDLLEAVKQFHQSIPEKLEQLTKSMDDIHTKEGLERYETLIHTIKNQAADIGAMRLAGMTRSLEEAMQAGAVVEAIKTFNQTICVELEGQDERLTNVLKES